MFSIGERSGLQAGQFSTRTLLLRSHAVLIAVVCGFALSCWNTQGLPWNKRLLEGSICCSKTFIYLSAFIVLTKTCKLPIMYVLMHHHTIRDAGFWQDMTALRVSGPCLHIQFTYPEWAKWLAKSLWTSHISTLPFWTVTVWSTLQSSEHQNDQTQEQFLSPSNPSHEHLILNVEHTTLLYKYLFTIHTFFLQICTSDLYTHNYLYCILCFYYFVHCLFVYCYFVVCVCPVAVILLHCEAITL